MSELLQPQAVVVLQSMASKRNLQSTATHGVAGLGKQGKFAKWIVYREPSGTVRFQNVANKRFLRIHEGKLDSNGGDGPFTQFRIIDHKGPIVSLESNSHRGQHVGILPNGDAKAPHHTQTGEHGQFLVHVLRPGFNPHQQQIVITPQVHHHPHPQPQVIIQQPQVIIQQTAPWDHKTIFFNGSVVQLTSVATGKNLRIMPNGTVNGQGGHGPLAKFIVHHVDHHGHIRLSAAADRKKYLRIQPDGDLDGNGGEGPWTIFRVKPQGHGIICLESVQHPGWHVGILPNGSAKSGKITGEGDHGRFKVAAVR